jgi:hypothetical protein
MNAVPLNSHVEPPGEVLPCWAWDSSLRERGCECSLKVVQGSQEGSRQWDHLRTELQVPSQLLQFAERAMRSTMPISEELVKVSKFTWGEASFHHNRI